MKEEPQGSRPLISFAILAYNQEAFIRSAVESAFLQNYHPLEIILSDDCSTDRTFDIMQELSNNYRGPHRVILRKNDKNVGISSHINNIIRECSGSIITWAAGDDIFLPDRTTILSDPLLKDSKIFATHSALIDINLHGEIISNHHHNISVKNVDLNSACKLGTSLVSQSMAFRKEIFDHFGPFRDDLTNEGPAMAFRATALGKVVYIEDRVTLYRIGSGTSTSRSKNVYAEKVSKPIKVSNWRRTSFLQMLDDSEKVENLKKNNKKQILKNVRFYTNLWKINNKESQFICLIKNLMIRPINLLSTRAILRSNFYRKAENTK